MSPLFGQEISPGVVLVVIAVVAMVAVVGWLSHKAQQKRTAEMAALADRLGCTFDPSKDPAHDNMYARFDIFQQGHSRAAYNTIRGRHEIAGRSCPLRMGDYTYKVTRSTGKSTTTTTYRLSYLILHLPFATPDLVVRREGVLDKLAGALGFDDIDFESEAFSRRYHVKCKDRKFAYAVVHPPVMEFLMEQEGPPIMVYSGCCCLTDGRGTWTAAEFESRLAWVSRFFALWPEYLMTELEGQKQGR